MCYGGIHRGGEDSIRSREHIYEQEDMSKVPFRTDEVWHV